MEITATAGPDKPKQVFYAHSDPEGWLLDKRCPQYQVTKHYQGEFYEL